MDRWMKSALLAVITTVAACAAPAGEESQDEDQEENVEASSDALSSGWVPANVTAGGCVGRSVTQAAFNQPMSVAIRNNCGYDVVISVGYKAGLYPREQNTPCYFINKGRSARVTPITQLINGTQNVRYDRVQICKKG